MTTRSLKPCAGDPLCPELVAGRYCDTHRRDRETRRGSAYTRGYDPEWNATRGRYLDQLRTSDPERLARCENCGIDEATAQDQDPHGRGLHVDHIDGLGPLGPGGHDAANLQALCSPCHGLKTAHQTGTKGGPS